jgi:flagellar biogenesis protein FliO
VIDGAVALRLLAACATIGILLAAFRFVALAANGAARRRRPAARALDLIETLHLPNAASVHLVRCGERHVLLGRTAAALVTIGVFDAAPAAAPARSKERAPARSDEMPCASSSSTTPPSLAPRSA